MMMPQHVLVLVVLPSETALLESDVAGKPVGRYIFDSLDRIDDVEIAVVVAADRPVPSWCSPHPTCTDRDLAHPDSAEHGFAHIVVVDGRAWLSAEALTNIIRRARETKSGLRLIESRPDSHCKEGPSRDLARVLPPGENRSAAGTHVRDMALLATGRSPDSHTTARMGVVESAVLDRSGHSLLVDSYAKLATVEGWILSDRATDAMRRGVRLRDPGSVYIRGEVTYGSDVEIDVDVILEGLVVLGNRVRIGAHSIIRASRIGENGCIHPFSLVEQSSIGANGFVGPYGRIRPGSVIGDGVQIGNYVEVKNSQIGACSRINHHSFIGDAVLAEHVTIGAGTITCNHDGTRTHQTLIERGAYVGSGCNLIAPVHIGAGATVGAGSTITRDVPAGKLTLARTPQTTVEHWRGPRTQVND